MPETENLCTKGMSIVIELEQLKIENTALLKDLIDLRDSL